MKEGWKHHLGLTYFPQKIILEDVIEARKQDIRGSLRRLIEETHTKNYHCLKSSISDDNGNQKYQQNDTFQDRLNFCLEKDLISFLKKKDPNKIIILHDVVTELKRCKINHISGLPQLQSMIGGHSKYLSLKFGNNERKQKVITVDLDEFLMFVNPLDYTEGSESRPSSNEPTLPPYIYKLQENSNLFGCKYCNKIADKRDFKNHFHGVLFLSKIAEGDIK